MTRIQSDCRNDRKPTYIAPSLTDIGHASEVILGVSGGGDDFMGYSEPEFEFEGDAPLHPTTDVSVPVRSKSRDVAAD